MGYNRLTDTLAKLVAGPFLGQRRLNSRRLAFLDLLILLKKIQQSHERPYSKPVLGGWCFGVMQ